MINRFSLKDHRVRVDYHFSGEDFDLSIFSYQNTMSARSCFQAFLSEGDK